MHYSIKHEMPGRLRLVCGQGLMSREEANGIACALEDVAGVESAKVRAANGSILVSYAPGNLVARQAALDAVAGFDVFALPVAESDATHDLDAENAAFARTVGIMVARRLGRRFLLPMPVRTVLTVFDSVRFIWRGLKELAQGKLTVEVLDATAIVAAMLQGQYASASSIMFLLQLSDVLEDHVNARTRIALQESLLTRAETVWGVDSDGNDFEMNMGDVAAGQLIRVRTGMSIPVDGTVMEGDGEVNEASMTGESALVHKRVSSTVFAGTVVEDGNMVVRVDALPGASRIDQIVRMVEESSDLKAGAQSRAEQLSDSLVPLSFLAFFAVLGITRNLTRAMTVLMVDFSCAIKLSTPVAVMSAMREASNLGMVVKGGKYLEALAAADTIVFDKTGTLTEAAPAVEKILCMKGFDEDEVFTLAACLEEHFPHSLARAIVQSAANRGLHHEDEQHAEVEYLVAHGITSSVEGKRVSLGSAHFIFEDLGVACPRGLMKKIEREAPRASTVFMAVEDKLAAVICISDPVRTDARAAIRALRALGVSNVVMLTGDAETAARSVAEELDINEYHAQVLPEDKSSYVDALKRQGHTVIMVGDGINDSPALAAADVSVALSDASDIARAVADVTVLHSSLDSLVVLRQLSQALMARIAGDYRFIVGFNSSLIALGVLSILSPTVAAMFHNVSTVAVTARNATPLLRQRA